MLLMGRQFHAVEWFVGSGIFSIVATLLLFACVVSPLVKCTTLRAFVFAALCALPWTFCLGTLGASIKEKNSTADILRGAAECYGILFAMTLIALLSWRAWAKWTSPYMR